MKERINELRVQIDGLAQLTKELKPINKLIGQAVYTAKNPTVKINSKEIEKAVDSLYLAKAWLGKILGELGNENPYKSGYKTKEDIEPTADVNDEVPFGDSEGNLWRDKNHIEKVDWLREEIKKLVEQLKPYSREGEMSYKTIYEEYSWKELQLARFWLGFELGRIRDNK